MCSKACKKRRKEKRKTATIKTNSNRFDGAQLSPSTWESEERLSGAVGQLWLQSKP